MAMLWASQLYRSDLGSRVFRDHAIYINEMKNASRFLFCLQIQFTGSFHELRHLDLLFRPINFPNNSVLISVVGRKYVGPNASSPPRVILMPDTYPGQSVSHSEYYINTIATCNSNNYLVSAEQV
jgi:hypothetical protein